MGTRTLKPKLKDYGNGSLQGKTKLWGSGSARGWGCKGFRVQA